MPDGPATGDDVDADGDGSSGMFSGDARSGFGFVSTLKERAENMHTGYTNCTREVKFAI